MPTLSGPAPPGLGGARPGRQRRARPPPPTRPGRRPRTASGRSASSTSGVDPHRPSADERVGLVGTRRRRGVVALRSPRARRSPRAIALGEAVRALERGPERRSAAVSPDAPAAVAIAARWSRIVRASVEQLGRLVELPGAHRVADGARQLPVAGRRDDLVVACPGGRPRVEQRRGPCRARPRSATGRRTMPRECASSRSSRPRQSGAPATVSGALAPPPTADVAPSPAPAAGTRRRGATRRPRPRAGRPSRPARRSPGRGRARPRRRSPRSSSSSRPTGPHALSGMRAASSAGVSAVAGRLDLERVGGLEAVVRGERLVRPAVGQQRRR